MDRISAMEISPGCTKIEKVSREILKLFSKGREKGGESDDRG